MCVSVLEGQINEILVLIVNFKKGVAVFNRGKLLANKMSYNPFLSAMQIYVTP